MTVRQTYSDRAASGMTLDRPELRKLIADCHAGKIGVVLVTDPVRLSRGTGQLVSLLDIFRKTGVRIEFTTAAGRTRFEFLRVVMSALVEFGAMANA
jgi:DNA invertase Pin-like site-specific DNA recombinase